MSQSTIKTIRKHVLYVQIILRHTLFGRQGRKIYFQVTMRYSIILLTQIVKAFTCGINVFATSILTISEIS